MEYSRYDLETAAERVMVSVEALQWRHRELGILEGMIRVQECICAFGCRMLTEVEAAGSNSTQRINEEDCT